MDGTLVVDSFGPLINYAVLAGVLVAALTSGFSRMRWWIAALIGSAAGDATFLYWVPFNAMAQWAIGFLPFAAVPAFGSAVVSKMIREKVIG